MKAPATSEATVLAPPYYTTGEHLRAKHTLIRNQSGRTIESWSLQLVPIVSPMHILDAGCGWGRFACLTDFQVRLAADDAQLATINYISMAEVARRRHAGHLPYVGYMDETAVTYGWVATSQASVGELNLVFPIAADSRYLWDFATLPEWQGRGLYPRLLQGIVQAERAERFWILHAPENLPSGAGMQKAGFQAVGQLSFQRDNSLGLIPFGNSQRARIGAELLGAALIEDGLSPC